MDTTSTILATIGITACILALIIAGTMIGILFYNKIAYYRSYMEESEKLQDQLGHVHHVLQLVGGTIEIVDLIETWMESRDSQILFTVRQKLREYNGHREHIEQQINRIKMEERA